MQHIPAVPDSIESAFSLFAKQTPNMFRSLELQRANLLRARADAERIRKTSAQDSPEHVAAKARLTALNGELKWVRDQTRGSKEYRRLYRFLIETIRGRLDQTRWALLVQERAKGALFWKS
ncbi:hypothetical protein QCE47_03240 [Caballeronia sp. LZ025]|uniref:hypothetical protein n=1 Tax=Caballeronia TaxID=1827195 RepID=UPI001FCFB5B3|nr:MULTISPECIES: hypothetical protein [Caballeronia]MDR5731363.1 hypothetical protein [Caballeronia sp. LZ025]